jgi:hypothetical protein
MPKPKISPKAAPSPASAASATADRLTITLFESDTAAIKRLRGGVFADTAEIATASEIIRFLLREAPAKLNAPRFLASRAQMQQEDGRKKRAASGR